MPLLHPTCSPPSSNLFQPFFKSRFEVWLASTLRLLRWYSHPWIPILFSLLLLQPRLALTYLAPSTQFGKWFLYLFLIYISPEVGKHAVFRTPWSWSWKYEHLSWGDFFFPALVKILHTSTCINTPSQLIELTIELLQILIGSTDSSFFLTQNHHEPLPRNFHEGKEKEGRISFPRPARSHHLAHNQGWSERTNADSHQPQGIQHIWQGDWSLDQHVSNSQVSHTADLPIRGTVLALISLSPRSVWQEYRSTYLIPRKVSNRIGEWFVGAGCVTLVSASFRTPFSTEWQPHGQSGITWGLLLYTNHVKVLQRNRVGVRTNRVQGRRQEPPGVLWKCAWSDCRVHCNTSSQAWHFCRRSLA